MPEDAAEEYKTNSFFAHIGYAITRWAFIDRDLFQFCHWALATTEAKTAVVFYGSAQIGVHISLTDTLMKQSVSGRDLKEWQAIKLELDRLLPLRNDLAHEPVQQIVHFDTFTRSPGMIVFTASPSAKVTWESRTEERKFLRKHGTPISVTMLQIATHIEDVEKLQTAMFTFRGKLPKRPRKRPTKPERPNPHPKKGSRRSGAHVRKRGPSPR